MMMDDDDDDDDDDYSSSMQFATCLKAFLCVKVTRVKVLDLAITCWVKGFFSP